MPRYDMAVTVHDGTYGEIEVEFEYEIRFGSAPVTSGPPESCDPGDPDEIEGVEVHTIEGAKPDAVCAKHMEQWLYDNRYDEIVEHGNERGSDDSYDLDWDEF